MALLNFIRRRGEDRTPLLQRCLSVDLEVDPKTARIFDMAAVRFGDEPAVVAPKGDIGRGLEVLEQALGQSLHILGHNILRHDIEHLLAARPRFLDKMAAPIDTLWLNPLPDAIEWLAEWAQDIRSVQRGLLLLTAHRAKGLEFDHVVILNGGWQHLSKGEDGEAPRRLFYVAMTRARRSLAVVTQGAHAFVEADSDCEMLRKIAVPARRDLPEPGQYQLPDMAAVDLSYAGRLAIAVSWWLRPSRRNALGCRGGNPLDSEVKRDQD